jgi:hypothetical protein
MHGAGRHASKVPASTCQTPQVRTGAGPAATACIEDVSSLIIDVDVRASGMPLPTLSVQHGLPTYTIEHALPHLDSSEAAMPV